MKQILKGNLVVNTSGGGQFFLIKRTKLKHRAF